MRVSSGYWIIRRELKLLSMQMAIRVRWPCSLTIDVMRAVSELKTVSLWSTRPPPLFFSLPDMERRVGVNNLSCWTKSFVVQWHTILKNFQARVLWTIDSLKERARFGLWTEFKDVASSRPCLPCSLLAAAVSTTENTDLSWTYERSSSTSPCRGRTWQK